MAGFRKAKAEQAALKMGIYGPPGSGKTFTSLLIAEGLAKLTSKRIAYIDTEHGTDFYCQTVPTRVVHPEAFDFDAIYTRSIMEALEAIKGCQNAGYGVVVLDSMTHLWQACIEAYGGRQTSAGTIPMHAWGKIKRPYKEMMTILLSSNLHVIICGRQGTEYATDEETDELKAVGVKMKAEGETPYEPHILVRMEAIKPKKTNEVAQIIAYAEKDRTGVLAGRSFINPTFETICRPILSLLGATQAQMESIDQTAGRDAERIVDDEESRQRQSAQLREQYQARIALCVDGVSLKAVGRMLTPDVKAKMLPADVATLRETYQQKERQFPATQAEKPEPAPSGQAAPVATAPGSGKENDGATDRSNADPGPAAAADENQAQAAPDEAEQQSIREQEVLGADWPTAMRYIIEAQPDEDREEAGKRLLLWKKLNIKGDRVPTFAQRVALLAAVRSNKLLANGIIQA